MEVSGLHDKIIQTNDPPDILGSIPSDSPSTNQTYIVCMSCAYIPLKMK